MKIWFTAIPLLFLAITLYACDPIVPYLVNWRFLLVILVAVPISLVLGFFVAVLLGSIILAPVYYYRVRKNGGPFREGDFVQILVGPYRGRLVRVCWLEQGYSVRVELGENETLGNEFGGTQLVLVARGSEEYHTR